MAINNLGALECLFLSPSDSVTDSSSAFSPRCGYFPMDHRGVFLPLSHPGYARSYADWEGEASPSGGEPSASSPIGHAVKPMSSHASGRDDVHPDPGVHRQLLERALAVWDESFSKYLPDKVRRGVDTMGVCIYLYACASPISVLLGSSANACSCY